MAGRGLTKAPEDGKRRGLFNRLNSHAGGRRSGDQFCVYLCDRLVIPGLSGPDLEKLREGSLNLDAATRAYVRSRLAFRYVATIDDAVARAIEDRMKAGAGGARPILNPAKGGLAPT